jgi:hypothetical protein
MMVRFGMPPGTPAFDQSAALSGFRIPLQFWATRRAGRQRQEMHTAAAGELKIPLFDTLFMA